MSMLNDLSGYGADMQDGLKRFANNAGLFERMLKKFPAAVAKSEVASFFEAGDYETALANAHTLKGMTGNLSLTPLYEAYSEIVALLRADKPAEAKALFEKILPIQEKIIACIEGYM